jgi:hypothetical protein
MSKMIDRITDDKSWDIEARDASVVADGKDAIVENFLVDILDDKDSVNDAIGPDAWSHADWEDNLEGVIKEALSMENEEGDKILGKLIRVRAMEYLRDRAEEMYNHRFE